MTTTTTNCIESGTAAVPQPRPLRGRRTTRHPALCSVASMTAGGSPERLAGNTALQRLVTEGEFAQRKVALASKIALAQPDNGFGRVVYGTIA